MAVPMYRLESQFKVAIHEDDVDKAEDMLHRGVDPDVRFQGQPALCLCVEQGHFNLGKS